MRVGFLGLGRMGEPMAANLLANGHDLVVWNRSTPAMDRLVDAGAERASTPWEVLGSTELTVEMLSSEAVIDEVLRLDLAGFARAMAGHGLLHMSTTSPDFSAGLGAAVRRVGGWYVEAPVSGSRVPAEQGRLVAMVAGDHTDIDRVVPVLDAMCGTVVRCGVPPRATLMKLAVNVHLIGLVTSLVEAWNYAKSLDLDLDVFAAAITSGQLSSPVGAVKLAKLRTDDFTPQAAIPDVHQNATLIADAASAHRIPIPLLSVSLDLLARTMELGGGGDDMIGVLRAIRACASASE